MIHWERLTKVDLIKIEKIGKRAQSTLGGKLMDVEMDVSATHLNEPLDLDGLLSAKDSDFGHDIHGIQRHLNRDTGKLDNCFLPRYTLKKHVNKTMDKKHATHLLKQLIIKYGQVRHNEALDVLCGKEQVTQSTPTSRTPKSQLCPKCKADLTLKNNVTRTYINKDDVLGSRSTLGHYNESGDFISTYYVDLSNARYDLVNGSDICNQCNNIIK